MFVCVRLDLSLQSKITSYEHEVIFFVKLPLFNVANLANLEGGSCTVPEAVVTVLCAPDDGCG